jgi:hypothetical protein
MERRSSLSAKTATLNLMAIPKITYFKGIGCSLCRVAHRLLKSWSHEVVYFYFGVDPEWLNSPTPLFSGV